MLEVVEAMIGAWDAEHVGVKLSPSSTFYGQSDSDALGTYRYVSANFHMAKDKKHVTHYAQWRSQADVDAMMADPASQRRLKKAGEIAGKIDPICYELRETHGPAA